MILIGISLLIGIFAIFLLYSLIVTLSTFEDLKWKDWLTLWPYEHWIKEFKEMFEMKIIFIGALSFSLLFYADIKLFSTVLTASDSSRKGECTCNCKACQESFKLAK